jgi:hypothetical protein
MHCISQLHTNTRDQGQRRQPGHASRPAPDAGLGAGVGDGRAYPPVPLDSGHGARVGGALAGYPNLSRVVLGLDLVVQPIESVDLCRLSSRGRNRARPQKEKTAVPSVALSFTFSTYLQSGVSSRPITCGFLTPVSCWFERTKPSSTLENFWRV